jgi:hypothetical protein
MAGKKTLRKLGAKRMWIRRWLRAGRISRAEANRFTRTLEQTGKLPKPAKAARPVNSGRSDVGGQRIPAGPFVTIQYDPARFRVQFTAIRRGRKAKS